MGTRNISDIHVMVTVVYFGSRRKRLGIMTIICLYSTLALALRISVSMLLTGASRTSTSVWRTDRFSAQRFYSILGFTSSSSVVSFVDTIKIKIQESPPHRKQRGAVQWPRFCRWNCRSAVDG